MMQNIENKEHASMLVHDMLNVENHAVSKEITITSIEYSRIIYKVTL